MDVLHARGRASAAEVRTALPDPPSYSAVRALLGILERKGHIRHQSEGARYVYLPKASREAATRTAFKRLITTFFAGSVSQAVAALLSDSDTRLSEDELEKINELVQKARQEGR
jgi:predicted transcriptional regulator